MVNTHGESLMFYLLILGRCVQKCVSICLITKDCRLDCNEETLLQLVYYKRVKNSVWGWQSLCKRQAISSRVFLLFKKESPSIPLHLGILTLESLRWLCRTSLTKWEAILFTHQVLNVMGIHLPWWFSMDPYVSLSLIITSVRLHVYLCTCCVSAWKMTHISDSFSL